MKETRRSTTWKGAIRTGPWRVRAKILAAIKDLLAQDGELLIRNVNERAISARLADHLRPHFPDWDVDCEYNRDGHSVKTVSGEIVIPDLIVHRRGTPDNFLVIEIKKSNTRVPDRADLQKLAGFRMELRYEVGLFVKFTTGKAKPDVSRIVWV